MAGPAREGKRLRAATRGGDQLRQLGLLVAGLMVVIALVLASRADAYVYWGSVGSIGRANTNGTGVNPSFINNLRQGAPCGIAVDAGHIYWTNPGEPPTESSGTIGRANLDGSGVDPSFINGLDAPCGLAVDADHVYWTGRSGSLESPSGTIGRANKNGTGVNENFISGLMGSSLGWRWIAGTSTGRR